MHNIFTLLTNVNQLRSKNIFLKNYDFKKYMKNKPYGLSCFSNLSENKNFIFKNQYICQYFIKI